MKDRIRKIRKEANLTQAKFAERLGLKRNTIATYETGKSEPMDNIIVSICREFGINEEWLRFGTGPMFVQPDTFSLDDFVKSKGATDLELEIMKTYFELDPKIRKTAMDHFKRRLTAAISATPSLIVPDTESELEAKCPPVDTSHASETDAG